MPLRHEWCSLQGVGSTHQLLTDLQQEVAKWQAEGNQVIILVDMNREVTVPDILKFCQALDLVKAITTLHGKALVPTHQRGQVTIDSIYASKALLQHAKGGFLPFGEVMSSNHQTVWLDIQAEHLGMEQQDPVISPPCWQLKCQDPRIVARYSQELQKEITSRGWEQQAEALYQTGEGNKWISDYTEQFNQLDKELSNAKLMAEH